MKTDALIDLLARNAEPIGAAAIARRLTAPVALGALASLALALVMLGPLPSELRLTPALWIKLAYAGALAAAALLLTARLARPLSRPRLASLAALGIVLIMLTAGAAWLLATPAEGRSSALFGRTWLLCPWLLLLCSLPALAALLRAVRHLAPTQLGHAGFACGLAAGALGALGYSLACPESSVTFVAIWYTLGIAMTALLGGLLGPRALRW